MTTDSVRSYALAIAQGYLKIFRSAGLVFAGGSVIVLISILIVTPLWLLATRFTAIYSITFLGTIAIVGLVATVFRLTTDRERRIRFFRRTLSLAGFLIALALLYLIVLLYSYAIYAAAVPLSFVFTAAVGLLLHGEKKSKN